MKKAQYMVMLAAAVGLLAAGAVRAEALPGGGEDTSLDVREARVKSIPALQYLPVGTAGVVAVGKGYAPMLAAAVTGESCADTSDASVVRSVSSAVVSVGAGGEQACRDVTAIQNCVQEIVITSCLKQYFSREDAGAVQGAVLKSLQETHAEQMNELRERLENLRTAPVYAAFTAVEGQEEAFRQFVGQFQQRLNAYAPAVQQTQEDAVWEIPMDRLMNGVAGDKALPSADRQELLTEFAKHKLYVLLRQAPGVLRIAIVADQPEAVWPAEDGQSLLAASELNGMDAHAENTQLTAWCSAALQACMWETGNTLSMLKPLQKLFADLAGSAPSDAPTFEAAAKGVQTLRSIMQQFPMPQRPMTLQIWRPDGTSRMDCGDGDIHIDFQMDACGASFAQGKVSHGSLAANSAIYMECTGLINPNRLDCSAIPDAVLDITFGACLTLNEGLKDQVGMGMMLLKQFRPQIRNIWAALSKIGDNLSTPMTLVMARSGEKDANGGLCLTVTDREAVAEGWRDIVLQLESITGALGMPSNLLDNLPLLTEQLPDGATSYELAFPVAQGAYKPQMIFGESELILAGDPTMAAALRKDDTPDEPFCGAVFALDAEELLRVADKEAPAGDMGQSFKRIRGQATVQDGMLHVEMNATKK